MLRPRALVVVVCGLLAVGTATATTATATTATATIAAGQTRGTDPCDTLTALRTDAADLESAPEFDPAGYRTLAKDFKKAAKVVPKRLRSPMRKIAKLYASVAKAENDRDAATAYGKGLVEYDEALSRFDAYYQVNCDPGADPESAGGTLTLGGETIGLSVSQCDLREQTIAGQKILWTARALGTDAAGDDVLVDVTRFDASSFVAGDSVRIGVGDPREPDFIGYEGSYPAETVVLSGTTITATGIEVTASGADPATASFEIRC